MDEQERNDHYSPFDYAYDRLCEAVADPRRTRATVRAQDLRIVLTELVHRK